MDIGWYFGCSTLDVWGLGLDLLLQACFVLPQKQKICVCRCNNSHLVRILPSHTWLRRYWSLPAVSSPRLQAHSVCKCDLVTGSREGGRKNHVFVLLGTLFVLPPLKILLGLIIFAWRHSHPWYVPGGERCKGWSGYTNHIKCLCIVFSCVSNPVHLDF